MRGNLVFFINIEKKTKKNKKHNEITKIPLEVKKNLKLASREYFTF